MVRRYNIPRQQTAIIDERYGNQEIAKDFTVHVHKRQYSLKYGGIVNSSKVIAIMAKALLYNPFPAKLVISGCTGNGVDITVPGSFIRLNFDNFHGYIRFSVCCSTVQLKSIPAAL